MSENWSYSISLVIYFFMLMTFLGSLSLYGTYKFREIAKKKAAAAKKQSAVAHSHGEHAHVSPVAAVTVVPSRKARIRFVA